MIKYSISLIIVLLLPMIIMSQPSVDFKKYSEKHKREAIPMTAFCELLAESSIAENLDELFSNKPEGDHHIDHILPVSAFDFTNEEHVKLCWLPENLQWLEKSENLSKGDKHNKKEFEEYVKKHSA